MVSPGTSCEYKQLGVELFKHIQGKSESPLRDRDVPCELTAERWVGRRTCPASAPIHRTVHAGSPCPVAEACAGMALGGVHGAFLQHSRDKSRGNKGSYHACSFHSGRLQWEPRGEQGFSDKRRPEKAVRGLPLARRSRRGPHLRGHPPSVTGAGPP